MIYNIADENFEISVAEFTQLIARSSRTKVVFAEQSAEGRAVRTTIIRCSIRQN